MTLPGRRPDPQAGGAGMGGGGAASAPRARARARKPQGAGPATVIARTGRRGGGGGLAWRVGTRAVWVGHAGEGKWAAGVGVGVELGVPYARHPCGFAAVAGTRPFRSYPPSAQRALAAGTVSPQIPSLHRRLMRAPGAVDVEHVLVSSHSKKELLRNILSLS